MLLAASTGSTCSVDCRSTTSTFFRPLLPGNTAGSTARRSSVESSSAAASAPPSSW